MTYSYAKIISTIQYLENKKKKKHFTEEDKCEAEKLCTILTEYLEDAKQELNEKQINV